MLNQSIPFMVRQAHHEWNPALTVRPEPVEGLVQCFLGCLIIPPTGKRVRVADFANQSRHYRISEKGVI
jgi:hypothetical protein